MVLLPNKSTADYFFAKAEQSFRRSRTNSNARNKLEALGNAFMVKAVELDVELQISPMPTVPPLCPSGRDDPN